VGLFGENMKLKNLLLMALASLTIATTAQAGLGWTLAECRQHYGKNLPFKIEPYAGRTEYAFKTKEFIIMAYILNGKVSRIIYSTDKGMDTNFIKNLLSTNAPEVSWGDPYKDEASNSLRWDGNEAESDKNIYWAQYNVVGGQNVLAIWNLEDNRAVKAANAETTENM
jgi:hypothetical protein